MAQWQWTEDTFEVEDEALRALSDTKDPYTEWQAKFGQASRFTEALACVDEGLDFKRIGLLEDILIAEKSPALEDFSVEDGDAQDTDAVFERIAENPQDLGLSGAALSDGEKDKAEIQRQKKWILATSRLVHQLPMREHSFPPNNFTPEDPPDWTNPGLVPADGPVSIVGVIDDGINPIHERFSHAGQLRMDYFWHQDGVFSGAGDRKFGRAYGREELEGALAAFPGDEEGALRQLGLINFQSFQANQLSSRVTHGTHVLDTAAGGMGPNVRLIGVQMPAMATAETSGALIGYFFVRGLQYILERAIKIKLALGDSGRDVPVYVNFSYGYSAGAHDGKQMIERAIEKLVDDFQAEYRRELGDPTASFDVNVTLPAGNRQLKRGHAVVRKSTETETVLPMEWRIHPADGTPNYLECWVPADSGDDIHVEISAPGAVPAFAGDNLRASPQILAFDPTDRNTVVARVSVDQPSSYDPSSPAKRRLWPVLIVVGPTEPIATGLKRPPSGLWTVKIKANLLEDETIHAWVPRDEAPLGYRRRGYQSFLDDPAYTRFTREGDVQVLDDTATESAVRRTGTISGMASGAKYTSVVGAFEGRNGRQRTAPYSATSVDDDPFRRTEGVQIAAQSDTSRVLRGILGAGAFSGSVVPLNGTSVAAPQVVRAWVERRSSGAAGGCCDLDALVDIPSSSEALSKREGRGRMERSASLAFYVDRERQA